MTARSGGMLGFFARHSVAANLVMLLFMVGGLMMVPTIRQEVFPEVTQPIVTVQIAYPGASPEEVEQGVILPVEDAVRGLDGVKEVRSVATEGLGIASVELSLSADQRQLLSEVESAVGRIASFPADAEKPVISLVSNRQQVISLILYGDVPEMSLRELAERARADLLDDPRITYVELSGVRPLEISVEVSRADLRRYGLTLAQIAERVRASSVQIPGGQVRERGGETLLRTAARKQWADELGRVVLIAEPGGARVLLRDVATVEDTLAETDQESFYDGRPAARIDVFRVGDERPLEVARAVHEYAAQADVPEGVHLATWGDSSEVFRDRIELLLSNGYMGLALVLLVLGLFLSPRLAFWVTLGIPVSFLGSLLFLPGLDVSINLISLFAFIVALGMVVDDAIVVGEAIQYEREHGVPRVQAAAHGARSVALPVILAVLTTCVAFAPMLFVPGAAGKLFRNIPIVVILVLTCSLIESLLVLPSHLTHPMPRLLAFLLRPFFFLMRHLGRRHVGRGLAFFVDRFYVPTVRAALRWRYLTVAIAVFMTLVTLGLWVGKRIEFVFMPKIEADEVSASIEMPVGTPLSATRAATRELERAARQAAARTSEGARLIRGIYTEIGGQRGSAVEGGAFESGGHLATVHVNLVPSGERDTTSYAFVERWRRAAPVIPGVVKSAFDYTTGASGGPDIDLEVSHPRLATLHEAARDIARALREYRGVRDVDDGIAPGKEQLDFTLTPRGRALGLSEADLAAQIRGAFYGAEAYRFQRARNEVRVFVRLPERERRTLSSVEDLIVRTPEGGEVPLREAANVRRTRADTAIQRVDGHRVVHVTANVFGRTNANDVVGHLRRTLVPRLHARWPALEVTSGGAQKNQRDAMQNLGAGFGVAMVVMYALLPLAFRSYLHPAVVMAAIPLGAIGAVAGHLMLGYQLSLSSMMGLVALAGVVVNDSLLLVSTINENRQIGMPMEGAIVDAGARRFRPILLTSLTTFLGLAPMIFQRSVQARFLIPMAISLGFGVLFATFLTVLVVPFLYRILVDAAGVGRRASDRLFGPHEGHRAG